MRKLSESLHYALKGLQYTIKTQRNMRIHLFIAVAIILTGIFLNLKGIEIAILSLAIIFVLITEVINTAMELSLDCLNGQSYHPLVKVIKDIVAGAVLISCINAVIIGCVIFLPHLIR